MFFGLTQGEFNDLAPEVRLFLALAHAVQNYVPAVRSSTSDKEFHFQKWVGHRLTATQMPFTPQGRNSYPDFILDNHPVGFEVKGLAYPGRDTIDMNSQMPLAVHLGRKVFYVFGRYATSDTSEAMVKDIVLCTASFLNAETENNNENDSIWGAGSYGDILIRDRRMYVSYSPFTLTSGTDLQITLILDRPAEVPSFLVHVGDLERTEAAERITSYTFDLTSNALSGVREPNPTAGTVHRFSAFKMGPPPCLPVTMVPIQRRRA